MGQARLGGPHSVRLRACARREAPDPDYTGRMQRIDFPLDPGREFVELNQLLKLAGLADSGGAGKRLVASGMVAVDGTVESRKTAKIRAGQTVTLGDVAIRVMSTGSPPPLAAG
jgi:ribosome-associated protein